MNLYVSRCYSCKGFAIWVRDQLVFPISGKESPNIIEADFKEVEEERDKTADDMQESTAILNRSPKGATAQDEKGSETATRMLSSLKEILERLKDQDEK